MSGKILLIVDPYEGINFDFRQLRWYGRNVKLAHDASAGLNYLEEEYNSLIRRHSKGKNNVLIVLSWKGEGHLYGFVRGLKDAQNLKRISDAPGRWSDASASGEAKLLREGQNTFGRKNVVFISGEGIRNIPAILQKRGVKVDPSMQMVVCGGVYSRDASKPGCVDTYSKQIREVLNLPQNPEIAKNATIIVEKGAVLFPWQRNKKETRRF